ncbi:MAG: tetratricopeptide repeat protein [Proteobacteria bacterium]|nr:tetratricopeptide repeat protein [Pseudomonadota bacterium]MBU1386412.1 tetratricopeptide repeat protein [Pseudomonadota bacterium]MBU1544523.1 tetratricopeptide repeat protein [Pseudomonadota bacterium]MBU2481023.1 tetratricopeptide repeat protein [Pseudomonadota bacterium]
MADRSVSNERRKELEQLDPFQEKMLKMMALIKENKKQLIFALIAVVLVIAVFSSVTYSFKKAEDTAAILVTQALDAYAGNDDPVNAFSKLNDDFQTIFSEYANTSAGRQALVAFAKICYDASKFDLSYKYYKEALVELKNDPLMENLILSSLGHVCIARKANDEAKKYFLEIETGESDLLKDEARYELAVLYEADNNPDESRKMYEKIVSQSQNQASIYTPIAKSKIAQMK